MEIAKTCLFRIKSKRTRKSCLSSKQSMWLFLTFKTRKGSFCHGWDDENHYGEGFITSDPSLEQLANHKMITAKQQQNWSIRRSEPFFRSNLFANNCLMVGRSKLPVVALLWPMMGHCWWVSSGKRFSSIDRCFFDESIAFSSELRTQDILSQTGTSYETLRRHVTKLNKVSLIFVADSITNRMIRFEGSEINIRVFFIACYRHTLTILFEEYTIHESHYYHFLDRLAKASCRSKWNKSTVPAGFYQYDSHQSQLPYRFLWISGGRSFITFSNSH